MHRFILFFLFPFFLHAAELHLAVKSVSDNGKSATVEVDQIAKGVHGFIVRHFSDEHSVIIADAYVSEFNAATSEATLALSEYEGLKQNSLPRGNWHVKPGDEAILAFGYSRALLLAPGEESYHIITKNIHGVEWIHPDSFATYLSYHAHPAPVKEDISGYCTLAEIGLLYIYAEDALFTLDCQTMGLIQITPLELEEKEIKLPFFSRVEKISTSWWEWGEASRPLESYAPHYLELMVKHNNESKLLYDYIKRLGSADKKLIKKFNIEE